MSAIHTALIAFNEKVIREVPQPHPSPKDSLGSGDIAAIYLGVALGLLLLRLAFIRYQMGRYMVDGRVIKWQGSAIPGSEGKSTDWNQETLPSGITGIRRHFRLE